MSAAVEGSRIDRLEETIYDMADSMVVNLAYHVNDPNVGMAFNRSDRIFKMYVCDTGLFVTLAFWDKKFVDNVIYEKLLNDKLSANLGYVYENMVAQIFRASGHHLYYYTFPKDDGRHLYEIDFLLSDGDKVDPIEVKSSGYKTHASLDAFFKKYHDRIKQQYLIYTKDLQKDGLVTYLPIYMEPFL